MRLPDICLAAVAESKKEENCVETMIIVILGLLSIYDIRKYAVPTVPVVDWMLLT